MGDAFIWWLTLEILGLVALPLAAVLLRALPDRGWAASKILGLLLVGWLAYMLAMVKLVPFGRLSLVLCLLVVAGLSAWLLLRDGRALWQELLSRYRTPRFIRYIITAEVLFALIFGIWALFKAYGENPNIWATEKFMDFGFTNSILKSTAFPPNDMWLSGHSINYYYFGYVLIAALCSLSGVRTEVGFNLANATLLALTTLGAFGFVYNIILGSVARRASQRRGAADADGADAAPPRNKQREREILETVSETKPAPAQPSLPTRRSRTGATAQVAAVAQAPTAIAEKEKRPATTADGNGRSRREGASNGRTRDNGAVRETPASQDAHEAVKLPLYLSPYIYAVLAALMVVAMGNLTTMFATKDGNYAQGGNGWKFCFSCQSAENFNWWNPSRVIRDYKTVSTPGQPVQKTPAGNETINEFPAFSFLLADMHPHVMALPLVLLALSAAYAVSRRKMLRSTDWRNGTRFWLPTVLIAIIIGSLYTANTWDYPTYLIILLACMALPYVSPAGRKENPSAGNRFLQWLLNSVVIVVLSFLVFLPFHLTFKSLVGGTPAQIPENVANIPVLGKIISMLGGLLAFNENDKTILGFIMVFGIFLVGLIGWLLFELTASIRSHMQTPEGAGRSDLVKMGIIIAAITVPMYILDIFLKSPLLLLLVPMIAIAIALLIVEPARTERNVALIMFSVTAMIALGIEFIYLRDVFNDRMNTLFKFYYQMWVIWGLVAGYGLWRVFYIVHNALNENHQTSASTTAKSRATTVKTQPSRAGIAQMFFAIPWATVFLLLVLSGLMYSVYGPQNKLGQNPPMKGLDGQAHLGVNAPNDLEAIKWIKDNEGITGDDVIVECCRAEYNLEGHAGRVSAFTGIPTILAWDGHESQWRGGQKDLLNELGPRRSDVNAILHGKDASGNPFTAETFYSLLDKYRVSYIFVGAVERGQSNVAGPAEEEHITPEAEAFYKQAGLTEAFRSGDTVIYKVPPQSARGGIDMNTAVQASTTPGQQPKPTEASSKKPPPATPDPNAPPAGLFDAKGPGTNPGQFNLPRGITRDAQGNFWVTDDENLRVQMFDKDGKFVRMFGSKGEGDGEFSIISPDATGTGPSGIAADKDGFVYIADTWNHRIQKFGPDGKFEQVWGGYINLSDPEAGTNDRKFFGPRGVAVGADGKVYVTDTGNKRVLFFDPDGNEEGKIDSGLSPTKKGPSEGDPGYPFDKPGELNEPVGVAVDKEGNVYIADTNNKRIQKFDKGGKAVAQWPVPDNNWGPGPYLEPFLALDGAGNVYVTAPTGGTVLKFSPDGKLAGQKNKQGDITLKTPTGIYVDTDGTVYVVDTGNSAVVNLGKIP